VNLNDPQPHTVLNEAERTHGAFKRAEEKLARDTKLTGVAMKPNTSFLKKSHYLAVKM